MQDFLNTVRQIVTEHGIKVLTAATFTVAGLLIGRWRSAQSWKKREFFDRLNVSLNSLHGGKLLIPIPKEDRWFYLNAVLNELSETFAEGLFKREAGKPHDAVRYLICLTNECDGEVRTRKVRAMVMRKDTLLNLPKEQPALESPNHSIRWKTLQQMQRAYSVDPTNFIEAEIVV